MPCPWKPGSTAHPISRTGWSCQVRSQYPTHPIPLAAVFDDDLVLAGVFLLVPGLSFDDLLPGLGTPDVLRHLRFVELHEEREVLRAPRLDACHKPVERVALLGHPGKPNVCRASPRHVDRRTSDAGCPPGT